MIGKLLKERLLTAPPVQATIELARAPVAPGRVCVVLVTFNRLALLQKLIPSLHAQTRPVDHILVIDNGSEDGTAEWLSGQAGLEVRRQSNLGNAGGQKTGFALALERGFDWLWCMDDDVAPIPEALEIQLKASEGKSLVIARRFRRGDEDYAASFDLSSEKKNLVDVLCEKTGKIWGLPCPPGDVITTNCGHFEGMLVPCSFVRQVGLPDTRFFLFGEDTIYGYLASKSIGCVMVARPLFEKLIPPPAVENFPAPSNIYFRNRNRFLFWEYLGKGRAFRPFWAGFFLLFDWVNQCKSILLTKRQKWKRLRFLGAAVVDGYMGRFGVGRLFEIR